MLRNFQSECRIPAVLLPRRSRYLNGGGFSGFFGFHLFLQLFAFFNRNFPFFDHFVDNVFRLLRGDGGNADSGHKCFADSFFKFAHFYTSGLFYEFHNDLFYIPADLS